MINVSKDEFMKEVCDFLLEYFSQIQAIHYNNFFSHINIIFINGFDYNTLYEKLSKTEFLEKLNIKYGKQFGFVNNGKIKLEMKDYKEWYTKMFLRKQKIEKLLQD